MAKLIIGIMHSNEKLLKEVKAELRKKFGEIEDELSYDFNFTKYYEEEMGKNIKKNLLTFKNPIKEGRLAEIKTYANKLEDRYRTEEKRRVNIDPGCLTKKELILLSNKKGAYKKEIAENIYAHLTLEFKNNKCVANYRTFPDFKTEKVQKFLLKIIQFQKPPSR